MRLMQTLYSLILTFPVAACADSPMMNHVMADNVQQVAAASCEIRLNGGCVSYEWVGGKPPRVRQVGQLRVVLAKPLPQDARLEVEPWMESMGHGSDEEVEVTQLSSQEFVASNLLFTMRGPWVVRIKILKADRVVEMASFRITF
jgi:hypothetical protein